MMHDVEALVLRMFPRYLRALTKNDGKFVKARRVEQKEKEKVDYITRRP